MAFFPFNPDNLAAGPGRFLYAPGTQTIPTKVTDVISATSPYAPKTGWVDGGGTISAPAMARALTVAGFGYQQSTGNVVERPNDIDRSVTAPFGELTPAVLEIVEQSTQAATTAGAGGTGQGAGIKVPFGTIQDLGFYRVALIFRFEKTQGLITETGGVTRGRLVMWTGFKASITADTVTTTIDEANPAEFPVTFKLFPDSSMTTAGTEYGFWWVENAPATLP